MELELPTLLRSLSNKEDREGGFHQLGFCLVQGSMVVGDEAKSAESQAACHTLAHELTEQRFPAPRMLSFKVLPCTF